MKYKLLKDLPLAKAGTEVELGVQAINSDTIPMFPIKWNENKSSRRCLGMIFGKDIPEWLEEVKEPKTIYDLKKGDTFWTIENCGYIQNGFMPFDYFEGFLDITRCFLTEREAKRNKLLRELATRMDKWLPEENEDFIDIYGNTDSFNDSVIEYHLGFIFRNEEYNKYITEEAKDLLFNI